MPKVIITVEIKIVDDKGAVQLVRGGTAECPDPLETSVPLLQACHAVQTAWREALNAAVVLPTEHPIARDEDGNVVELPRP